MKSVDWFITKKCLSHSCPFCFAPYDAFPNDADYNQALSICKQLETKQVEYVTLCGGEPLVYNWIDDIVKCLHRSNIKIVFNTGLVSNKDIFDIIDFLHILSLPFEACDERIQNSLRGGEVHRKVISILEKLKQKDCMPKIKIGTVINRINLVDIENVYKYLVKYQDIISIWRLYMFSPYGIGKENIDKLLISEEEYGYVVDKIQKMANADGAKFTISTRSRADNIGYCFIMDSQGSFYKYNENYDFLNVSIYDDFDIIKSKYDENLNAEQKKWQI